MTLDTMNVEIDESHTDLYQTQLIHHLFFQHGRSNYSIVPSTT